MECVKKEKKNECASKIKQVLCLLSCVDDDFVNGLREYMRREGYGKMRNFVYITNFKGFV